MILCLYVRIQTPRPYLMPPQRLRIFWPYDRAIVDGSWPLPYPLMVESGWGLASIEKKNNLELPSIWTVHEFLFT